MDPTRQDRPRDFWTKSLSEILSEVGVLAYLKEALARPDLLPAHLTWIFTLSLAIFAYVAWREATISSQTRQNQLAVMREDQRPWIYPVQRQLDWFCTEVGSVGITVGFHLTNVGKSPAYHVVIRGNFSFPTRMSERMRKAAKTALGYIPHDVDGYETKQLTEGFTDCEYYRRQPEEAVDQPYYIYPGQKINVANNFTFQTKDMYKDKKKFKDMLFSPAAFNGCVDYSFNDTKHHQARFTFLIENNQAGQNATSVDHCPNEKNIRIWEMSPYGDAFDYGTIKAND